MTSPIQIHLGNARISFQLLILGAGFDIEEVFKSYCENAIEELWKIHPFEIAKEKLSIWGVCSLTGADPGYFVVDSGKVSELNNEVINDNFSAFSRDNIEFPAWGFWSDIREMRKGVIVVEFGRSGYEDFFNPNVEDWPDKSICTVVQNSDLDFEGILSTLLFNRVVIIPAFPLGDTQVSCPENQIQCTAVAAQIAKSIGLILGLGDEYEGLANNAYEGSSEELPANLDVPNFPNTQTDIPNDWKWWAHRRSITITNLPPSQGQETEKIVYRISSGNPLILQTPMVSDQDSIVEMRGANLIEGGRGYQMGIYRPLPNCILRLPWRYDGFDAEIGVFTAQKYCPICLEHVQSLLLGYSNYKLGQKHLDPMD